MRRLLKKFSVALILAALGFIGLWDGRAEAGYSEGAFCFAVLGDNRSTAPVVQPLPFRWAIEEINLMNPDFVVLVGDLIRGYTSDNELVKKEWDEFDRITAALPWSTLAPLNPERLSSCGFNVIVNDNDGQGRKGWIQWTPGLGEGKDTSWYGNLIFEE